jgi:hypothetical protein
MNIQKSPKKKASATEKKPKIETESDRLKASRSGCKISAHHDTKCKKNIHKSDNFRNKHRSAVQLLTGPQNEKGRI